MKADSRIRTDDLIITNDLLYQLSYIGVALFARRCPLAGGSYRLQIGYAASQLRGHWERRIIALEKFSVK